MAGIAALALAYVLSQLYRTFLAVLTPVLATDLGASKSDLALASGAWFAVFAAMQFAVGIALDKFGPRRTAAWLLAIGGGGGAALFAFATTPFMLVVGMGLIGAGCAPVLMASFFIFARSYSPARFAALASFLVGFGNAGNVIASSPLATAAEAFGWRAVMAALALVTVSVALAILLLVRDPEREDHGGSSGLAGYLEILSMRVIWPLVPLIALNYAPVVGIRGLWAGPFLSETRGLDAIAIGHITLAMALAMVAGNFAYGPLDRWFGTRKWVAATGNAIGVAVLVWLALNAAAPIAAIAVSFVAIGFFGSAYGLLMAHARAFFPPHLLGRGVTLMNFFSIGGVGVMQVLSGSVVAGASVPGEPYAGYIALFWFYVITLGLAVALYLASRDARPEVSA